ncbi:Autophagy protein 22 [Mortierella sp. GBA43]|nr:Autophagy protein 22 [Mortierella sp. GBA43]
MDSAVTLLELTELDLKEGKEKQDHRSTVTPLRRSELWAWYIQNATYCGYGWLAAPLMVPILIQDMASRAGVEASNHSIPCNTTIPGFNCVTPILGYYLEPGTISLYISSLSSILSFFCSLSISAVADHGSYRKSLLIAFSALGCINSLAYFLFQVPSLFWIGAILSPLGWTFYNITGVFSHSFLPLYGRAHPDVLDAEARGEPVSVVRKILEQRTNDISAYSSVVASFGSVIIHAVCIAVSLGMKETSLSLEIAIGFTAYHTLKSFRSLPEIFKYMMAWYILSDGINTIPAIAYIILYRELAFTHVDALILSISLAAMASMGAYIFLRIRKLWNLTTRFMILLCLTLYAILMLYFVVAPMVTTNLGLKSRTEGWVCTLYTGFIISTFYSSTRVLLSELCPENDENEWFSLYLLADKGSSWIGPLVTGAIFTVTNDYRSAFWFPLALIVAGAGVLLSVDVDLGKEQARQFAREKRERQLMLTRQNASRCSTLK